MRLKRRARAGGIMMKRGTDTLDAGDRVVNPTQEGQPLIVSECRPQSVRIIPRKWDQSRLDRSTPLGE